MSDPAITAALIASGVALLVGLLSSIIALISPILDHRLTRQREAQKYFDEVYKELFAPIIPDVFLYIDMATQPMEVPPKERQIEVKDRAIEFIGKRLVHASPKL